MGQLIWLIAGPACQDDSGAHPPAGKVHITAAAYMGNIHNFNMLIVCALLLIYVIVKF